ncbi:TadE/TadG family type IV pilus assembly protein [Acetobacter orientalis]|uniref:TadE/TadG family type IV pilus assembly protein n=1 Tax=Acetobacter orientalis TaxID=146474 RepID=UPI0039E78897
MTKIFFSAVAGKFIKPLGPRGVAAIEFAIVGPIVLFLLLNTFLCAILYFYQMGLTSTADYTARQVITGQAACRQSQTSSGASQSACNQSSSSQVSSPLSVRQDICAHGLPIFMSCANLTIKIQHSETENSANFIQSISQPKELMDIGGAGDFIFVTLYYNIQIPLFYPLFNQDMQTYFMQGLGFSSTNNGTLIISTAAARSEPF